MTSRSPLPSLGRRALVVASLGDYPHLLKDAKAAVRAGADLLEIRADLFPRSTLTPPALRELLSRVRTSVRRPLLLTLRCRAEGGKLPHGLSELDRLALFRAALSKVDGVDVELRADDVNHHLVFEAHKRGCFVILSSHDFRKTPSDATLKSWVRKARRLRVDILKVAATPHHPADVERFMTFCRRALFRHRAFLPMGPLGKESRKQGFRWKSCLTYGYIRKPLAPGQLSVKELAKAQGKRD